MKENTSAVAINQLTVNYEKQPAIWNISLKIPEGMLTGIIGPNGAGKSTLIKSALGLLTPISGSVLFFGKPIDHVRERVAYVPQKESVDWDFPITVEDLVLMGRYGRLGLFKWPTKKDRAKVAYYLEMVGMSQFAKRQISQLSGGQQQRAFLARALAQEADLYFMDEPFTGIDTTTEKLLLELFQTMCRQGKTLIIVHHELASLEKYYDWIVMLNMRLIASGSIKETLNTENLNATYQVQEELFDKALKLSRNTSSGLL